jgi:hypothetical protein
MTALGNFNSIDLLSMCFRRLSIDIPYFDYTLEVDTLAMSLTKRLNTMNAMHIEL